MSEEEFQQDDLDLFEEAIKSYLHPITDLLEDESISEIMINGPQDIWIERSGKVVRAEGYSFSDEDALRAAVNNIAQSVDRTIDDKTPRLDARLRNGYRIHAVIPPCARNGTTVAIRKFFKQKLTLKDLVKFNSISVDAAFFLNICMMLGKNVIVSGGTGSGKTTLLSILCDKIPPGQRIIVIEDSSELAIDYEHVVFFETRMADALGNGAVTIEDLVKSSLRLRPDRIIVGEVRGGEALDLIQAMNTGHKGCLGTVHANTPPDAMVRLEALAQGADSSISEKALRHQIGGAVDIIVQASRLADGSRRITYISECRGFDANGAYDVVPIYQMGRLVKTPDGKLIGGIEPTGEIPSFMDEIEDNKIPFDRSKFRKSSAA